MSDEQQQKIEEKEEEKMEKKVEEKPATAKFAKSAKMVFLPSKNGKLQQITFTGKLNIKKKEKTPPQKAKTPPKIEQPQKIDLQLNEQKIEKEKKNITFSQNDEKEMTPPIKPKTPPKQVEFYLGYDKFKLFEHIQDIQHKLKSAKEQYRKNKIEEYQNLQRIEQEEKRKKLMKMKQDEIIEREPFRSGTTSQKQLFSDFQGFQKQFKQNKKLRSSSPNRGVKLSPLKRNTVDTYFNSQFQKDLQKIQSKFEEKQINNLTLQIQSKNKYFYQGAKTTQSLSPKKNNFNFKNQMETSNNLDSRETQSKKYQNKNKQFLVKRQVQINQPYANIKNNNDNNILNEKKSFKDLDEQTYQDKKNQHKGSSLERSYIFKKQNTYKSQKSPKNNDLKSEKQLEKLNKEFQIEFLNTQSEHNLGNNFNKQAKNQVNFNLNSQNILKPIIINKNDRSPQLKTTSSLLNLRKVNF